MSIDLSYGVNWLPTDSWQAMQQAHEERIGPFLDAQLARRAAGKKHPVYDFLFEYYSFKPAKLRRWLPGAGHGLWGAGSGDFLDIAGFEQQGEGAAQPLENFPEKRKSSLSWVIELLRRTHGRRPQFGCFGLHEWAMVYDESDIRHPALPLRLSQQACRELVESLPMCCSHFDAFRFFSEGAKPLNRISLEPESRMEKEQGGCLHANMDLYKWTYKFYPWLSSALLLDAFFLALDARTLDMRASPYDVRELGLEAIEVEHAQGRKEYAQYQRDLAERAVPVRKRLIKALDDLRHGKPKNVP